MEKKKKNGIQEDNHQIEASTIGKELPKDKQGLFSLQSTFTLAGKRVSSLEQTSLS